MANTKQLTHTAEEVDAAITSVGELAPKVAQIETDFAPVLDSAARPVDYSALPLLCGQPPILFGAGTPQESVVPINWNQYDIATDTGYNWNGDPSAIGQQYINTSASSRALYVAVPDTNGGLTWKNV